MVKPIKGIEMTAKAVSKNSNFCVNVKKNRQSMTARGYCCYYLEHCSKTSHVVIKGVIKRAKYENVFGLVAYQKHADYIHTFIHTYILLFF